MLLTIHNRALLRGVLAGAVILGGVSACSRPDRADAGRDTTQTGVAATTADTQVSSATQAAPTDTAAAPVRDTGAATTQTATRTPRPEPSRPAAEPKADAEPASDQGVSGYQAMGHDTQPAESASVTAPPVDSAAVDSAATEMAGADPEPSVDNTADTVAVGDSAQVGEPGERIEPVEAQTQANADTLESAEPDPIRPPEDSSETLGVSDTAAAGYEPMARDTSVALAQGDTAAVQAQVDTTAETHTELAVEDQADTVTVVSDSAWVDQPGPRAQEDSTEVLGQVTEDEANYDVEAIGDANGEPVGAAQVESTGNIATGADAVALLTREGQPCRVEDSRDVQWDMASSPATLNPCGSGTMTLPKVQTGEKE